MVAVASRSHRDEKTDEFLSKHKIANLISAGSSLKLCLVATGEADIYRRVCAEMDRVVLETVLRHVNGTRYARPSSWASHGRPCGPSFVPWVRPLTRP